MAELSNIKIVLWCYLLWYLVVFFKYFEPNLELWLTSLGLAIIVGVSLTLNAASGGVPVSQANLWQTFRFFLTPFCVSSFSALVKGKGFFLIFSPKAEEVILSLSLCLGFCALAFFAKRVYKQSSVV
ncbi:MAG: hypothetical protein K2W82_12995 [Candidatus Obscuribacterales bacterium]|nr:hypothetical protein [Candidatus Obscuribacterales bacterium]